MERARGKRHRKPVGYKDPTVLVEAQVGGAAEEIVCVECGHDELYGFFNKLQDIQRSVDQLTSP